MTSRHGGFRGVFDHGGLIRHIEQIFHRILDLVLDAELYVDDVFVAREHTGLFGAGNGSPPAGKCGPALRSGSPLPHAGLA